MSNAFVGVGTQLKRGNDETGSEDFTAIAEVTNIAGPTMTRDSVEVTSLDSTGGYREFVPGFRDPGEITLNMNFTLGTWNDFLVDFELDRSVNYEIVFSDAGATVFDFSGFCTALPVTIPTDDRVMSEVTLKLSGPIAVTT
jgi:predicted secreted protein